jgi:hypothetical protein
MHPDVIIGRHRLDFYAFRAYVTLLAVFFCLAPQHHLKLFVSSSLHSDVIYRYFLVLVHLEQVFLEECFHNCVIYCIRYDGS